MRGERLAELRKDKQLTQQDLADKLGLAASTISSYEIENSTPDDETKIALAQIFNISLDYLLGAIEEELPLRREDRIDLPSGFPKKYVPILKDMVSMIMYREKSEKHTTRMTHED